jgi:hypothetical protein
VRLDFTNNTSTSCALFDKETWECNHRATIL